MWDGFDLTLRGGELNTERERSLFAISVTTNTITISHNGRLQESGKWGLA